MPVQSPVQEKEQTIEPSPSCGSTQPSFIDLIPPKLVLLLASPYIAGKTAQEALKKAHEVYAKNKFAATLDILGEDAKTDEDCNQSLANYKSLIDLVASNPVASTRPRLNEPITISFKPSMFSSATPQSSSPNKLKHLNQAGERIEALVRHAQEKNVKVTLEAEDHKWTDFQLDTYFSLLNAGYLNLGTVLQSRLFRTKKDILRFDERARVRMVIGIYNEPADIAFTQKAVMKELAVEYANELLKRSVYVELASHDTSCLNNFIQKVVLPQRVEASCFEIQYLMGVPRQDIQKNLTSGEYFTQMIKNTKQEHHNHLIRLAETGALVRLYLPYGQEQASGPYCKRRLKANPNIIVYGIKNLLGIR